MEENHMKKVISTTNAPAAIGPYSQAIEANGFVFASGQIPVNPETGEIPEGIEAQAEQVMKNVKNLLEAAGTSVDQVVKTGVFIKNMDDFATINGIYAKYFAKDCRHVPAWRLQDFRRTSFLRWKRSQ